MQKTITVLLGIGFGLILGYFVSAIVFGSIEQIGTVNGTTGISKKGQGQGRFELYHEGVIGKGKPAVLFFHAQWSPVSRGADKELQSLYDAKTPNVNMYRANFDTETDLRKTYRVTREPTFVLVDGTGKAKGIVQGYSSGKVRAFIE